MVAKPLNTKRIKWLKIFVILSIIIGLAIIIYFPNYAKLKKLRDANRRIILENKKLEEEIADYKQKREGIGKDPYLYERIARDELGAAKEGEIVIDIEE